MPGTDNPALCGFANTGMAYCRRHAGDEMYQTLTNNLLVGLERTDRLKCNPQSTVMCSAFLTNTPSDFLSAYVKFHLDMIGASSFYQHNDQCT